MIEYLFIFILSVICSLVWEWTEDKHKRLWYLYVGILIVVFIGFISSAIFNPQSSDRKVLTSWEAIPLIVSNVVGWTVGKEIYHYQK